MHKSKKRSIFTSSPKKGIDKKGKKMENKNSEKKENWQSWAKDQELNYLDKIKVGDVIGRLHLTRIGGSVTPAILGLSRWQSPYDVYLKMTGHIEPYTNNFVFERGHACEWFVAEQACELLKAGLFKGDIVKDKNRPWSISQIDAYASYDGRIRPLECKVTSNNAEGEDGRDFGRGCQFNENGEILTEDDLIPVEYFIQCQKQMMLSGRDDYMFLAVWLTFENRVRVFKIKYDKEICKKIVEAEDDFLFNHVMCKDATGLVQETYTKPETNLIKGKVFNADLDFENRCRKYNAITKQISALKNEQEEIKKELLAKMQDCTVALNGDKEKLLSLTQIKTQRFDSKKFANEHADLYGNYLKESSSVRFNFSKKLEGDNE